MAAPHALSLAVGAGIYAFYHVTNYALQAAFYGVRGARGAAAWKTQPAAGWDGDSGGGGGCADSPWVPWVPACAWCRRRRQSHPWAWLLSTVNAVMAACAAAATTEAALHGATRLYNNGGDVGDVGGEVGSGGWAALLAPRSTWEAGVMAAQLAVAVVHENVVEYWWHRAMHTRWLYSTMHKIHHANKAPRPFDDMLIHPVEALGYYCILYSPPFLYTMHVSSFIAYMVIMGLAGVLDHSGIMATVPGFYCASDHDRHHSKFNVNFGFPNPWLDILHGTFDGEYCGRRYTALAERRGKAADAAGSADGEDVGSGADSDSDSDPLARSTGAGAIAHDHRDSHSGDGDRGSGNAHRRKRQ